MIDAREFRIGNWVEARDGKNKSYVQVDGFLFWHFQLANADGGQAIEINSVQPIPLTPEILESCGFGIKSLTNGVNYIPVPKLPRPLIIVFVQDHFILSMRQDAFPELIDLQARGSTLHQLQNLYFALTGEELQINLNVETR